MKELYIITGSAGLIGKHIIKELKNRKLEHIIGIDNFYRNKFFEDVIDYKKEFDLFRKQYKFEFIKENILKFKNKKYFLKKLKLKNYDKIIVFHTAAQPAHMFAYSSYENFMKDYEINTSVFLLYLFYEISLEKEVKFIFTSSSKVYGEIINQFKYKELPLRYELMDFKNGFPLLKNIDHSPKSFLGVSKYVFDLYLQEFYYNNMLNCISIRTDCITGNSPTGSFHHGYLSYLIKSLLFDKKYTIIGYKGKQVRSSLDAEIYAKILVELALYNEKYPKPVYNLSSLVSQSILESINFYLKADYSYNDFKKNKIKNYEFTFIDNPRPFDYIYMKFDCSDLIKDFKNTNIPKYLEESKDLEKLYYNIEKAYKK